MPRLTPQEVEPEAIPGEQGRAVQVITLENTRASHALSQNTERVEDRKVTPDFEVGDLVLVANEKALDASVKFPAYKLRFYGRCTVKQAKHPLYRLESDSVRHSCTTMHARRLRKYHLQSNQ